MNASSSEPRPSRDVPTREDLERQILGEQPSLTTEEVVEGSDEQAAAARRLWRALGFPDSGGASSFTYADKEAIGLLTSLVDAGALDLDTALKLTRAVGHTMGRLADWQVATLSEHVEGIEQSGRGTGSRIRTGLDVVHALKPPFEELMVYAWRRHLAAAVSRVEALGAQDSNLHTTIVTVGFADLVSFTRLSNGIGEDHLADLVEDFESNCADIVTGAGGRVIKTLGDSVLFIAGRPATGVDIACEIVNRIGGYESLPDVHVGLATGPVVMRLGDVFGRPVNMASRLTGVARRNRVICDVETANALAERGGYAVRPLTERFVRGFGPVQPIAVRRL